MNSNLYVMELEARQRILEAQAAAARYHLRPERLTAARPTGRGLVARLRAAYVRWSSPASAGSKPTIARA